MTKSPFEIRIESILGGQSPTTHFSGAGQFRASLGIDPAQPIDDNDTIYSTIASGLIRPAASEKFSGTIINAAPLWIKTNPKNSYVYVYDALGSAYTINSVFDTVTALSDDGALSSALGNGLEYYDNYMYFAKNTDICRYGPLNGNPLFNSSYWTSTLAKTALANTTYPSTFLNDIRMPNHVLHRHSDGILYVSDVVDNQGYIHTIQTKKTTVEGDTDNSSTYLKLGFGYGLWPTALETYGSDLAIALFEGTSIGLRQKHAKIAFWDTSSTSFNKITWVEFPDAIIFGMKNINGVLYVVSGNYKTRGYRITRFMGGYSFDEVDYCETGEPPLAGAIDGILNRVVFGSHTTIPESDGCVYSVGLQKSKLSTGLFNIMRATGGDASTNVTAVAFVDATELGFYSPIIGWTKGSGTSSNGLDKQGSTYNTAPSMLWTNLVRIGKDFKITEIRFPLVKAITTNMALVVKIYVDDGVGSFTCQTVNYTNFGGKQNIVLKADSAGKPITGKHNYWLEFKFTGIDLTTIGLPVVVKGEVYDY